MRRTFHINWELRIVPHDKGHERECSICNGDVKRLIRGKRQPAAAAEFSPGESMGYAAVYCAMCIDKLHAAIHPKPKTKKKATR